MAEIKKHDDFGEKIGGAKKDLWQRRGLISEDLSEMNSREADKYVKKDNVWKKPDYQAMIESGIPVDVVFFIKTVRDNLPASPVFTWRDDTPEKRFERQKEYIDTVRDIQTVVESVKSKADVFNAFSRCMFDNGYFERLEPGSSSSYYASVTQKGRDNTTITNKLSTALFIKSESDYEYKVAQKAVKEQFGVSKEEKVPRGYEIRFNDGRYSYSKNNDWKQDTYYVTKGHRIMQQNFEKKEDALRWLKDYIKERGGNGKTRFVPKQLAHIQREGPDYRRGKDVDGQSYLDTFGFRGGEFGNWVNQNERQVSLNYGFDALKDLARALQISDKDISYNGALSIAFGARGSGKAVAHYEPLRKVINLTKMNGAGSLAHEWWHGLDDFLGSKKGIKDLLSENTHKYPLFHKLIDTIKYKPEPLEAAAAREEKQNAVLQSNAESWLKPEFMPYLNSSGSEKAKADYEALKDAFLHGEIGCVDKLSELKKCFTGRVIKKGIRDKLLIFEKYLSEIAERSEPIIGKTDTEYYRNSKKMGKVCEKDGSYWESNTELTARAFATYIMDKLDGCSDYLVGHAECAVGMTADKDGKPEIIRAYPQGEERKAINAVFDEIVADLKLQKVLTHEDKAQLEQQDTTLVNNTGLTDEKFSLIYPFLTGQAASRKPSVIGGLAAAKEAINQKKDEMSQTPEKMKKPHDAEL